MDGCSIPNPVFGNDPGVLDVKPLRTLSPMFPAALPLGFNTFTPPEAPSLLCFSPYGSFATNSAFPSGFSSLYATCKAPQSCNPTPVDPVSVNGVNRAAHIDELAVVNGSFTDTEYSPSLSTSFNGENGGTVMRCLTSGGIVPGGSKKKKSKRKRPKKVDSELLMLACSSHESRESVEVVLMTFDALRRRLMQLEGAKDVKHRPDLKAGSIMMSKELRANKVKRVGQVPGVEVGDIFYFRVEMCLVGLNSQLIAGIDYVNYRFGDEDDTVALSVVSAGVYENAEENVDVLIYSGQGASSKDDQKLERGNLALERSLHRGNEIRVIRSAKDFSCPTGKIYIYDGLYKIRESWIEKRKSGFNVFKYKLVREPDQPDAIAVWKMTEKWRENPSSRGKVILSDMSSGMESRPVCLVNEIDNEKGPAHFTYSTRVKYLSPLSSMKSLQGCLCTNVCLPGDANCSCSQHNSGELPYSSTGILISRRSVIYECNESCRCFVNCRNRLTQKSSPLHFEVFKTKDRGWGLRCWEPIRAGTFVCEYTGEVIDRIRTNEYGEEDEYIFQTMHADPTFRWNYGPELLGEPSRVDLSETSKPLPIIISAKNVGNVSRFMNHSCTPNVFWQPVLYDHGDDGYPHIMFFAIKHIPPMTELTYDYGLTKDQVGNEEAGGSFGSRRIKKCLCESSKCRGSFC
ncbi:histone-lysine N-methyltransferase, H3 lysine-9 specific SUVH1-like [Ananas comosus]|uniref:Histone-lysine N-methyltransferase, H3 lysine-9 specific SUVH1-like n=1 Tax=Ananas comosus TaxID=4615 RepID=A0A6P5GKR3_ANACO|nr:histone-lysine N-methyltransferase, H3 lysine-9 specific SUVH1-like [Ananas comosus]